MAVSDSLGMYAHTRPAIMIDGRTNLVESVARLVEGDGIDEVVVGVALSMSGADSAQAGEARTLIAKLRERLAIPVTEWDERLSSAEAAKADPKASKKRTGELDSLAAAIVLQAVLDSRRGAWA